MGGNWKMADALWLQFWHLFEHAIGDRLAVTKDAIQAPSQLCQLLIEVGPL